MVPEYTHIMELKIMTGKRTIAVMSLFFNCLLGLLVGPALSSDGGIREQEQPQVLQAWNQHGIRSGYIESSASGLRFYPYSPDDKVQPGQLLSFQVSFPLGNWKVGVLSRLPVPTRAFGLDLSE